MIVSPGFALLASGIPSESVAVIVGTAGAFGATVGAGWGWGRTLRVVSVAFALFASPVLVALSVFAVFAITVAYATVIGAFNWLTGSNYMYLAAPPENPSLLSILGPWPWYLLSATGVAIVLFAVLDAPFRPARRRVLEDAQARSR